MAGSFWAGDRDRDNAIASGVSVLGSWLCGCDVAARAWDLGRWSSGVRCENEGEVVRVWDCALWESRMLGVMLSWETVWLVLATYTPRSHAHRHTPVYDPFSTFPSYHRPRFMRHRNFPPPPPLPQRDIHNPIHWSPIPSYPIPQTRVQGGLLPLPIILHKRILPAQFVEHLLCVLLG